MTAVVDVSSSNFSLQSLSKLKVVDLKRIAADLQIKKLPKLKRDIIQIILRHSQEESTSNSTSQKEPDLSENNQSNQNVDNLKIFEAMILAQMKRCLNDSNDLAKLLDSPITEEVEEIILKIFDRFCEEIS
ncbi:MAG: hypothetical protein MHMPM18_001788 [Marteilia pararefringens]